jgi:hypothetical protein
VILLTNPITSIIAVGIGYGLLWRWRSSRFWWAGRGKCIRRWGLRQLRWARIVSELAGAHSS